MASTARIQRVRRREDPTVRDANGPERHEGDAILRHLNDFLNAFMWQADPATLRITFVTTSVRDLLGHPKSLWLGPPEQWSTNIHPQDRQRVVECLRATGTDGVDREVEFRAKHADGRTLQLHLAVRLVEPPSSDNELWGITTDVTSDARAAETLRAAQERYRQLSRKAAALRRQTLEDPLTKLPNRALFDDRVGATLRNAQRTGAPFAVLLMDLDRFKEVNDTLGHQAGDAVLREVALRIRICLRAQDTPARLGGDEFAVLLPDVDGAGCERVASRIIRAMKTPFAIDGKECAIGISVGIAMFPEHGGSLEKLLAGADVAMYRAKRAGGHVSVTHEGETPSHRVHRRRRLPVLSRLVIGAAAGLAILAGASLPVALTGQSQRDSASRLESATTALEEAKGDDIADVVAGAERTLADISWNDVAGPAVVTALDHLHQILIGLKSGASTALLERVERLLATVRRAELVAQLSVSPMPAPIASLAPKVSSKEMAKAPAGTSGSKATPDPVATIPAPGLP